MCISADFDYTFNRNISRWLYFGQLRFKNMDCKHDLLKVSVTIKTKYILMEIYVLIINKENIIIFFKISIRRVENNFRKKYIDSCH